MRIRCALVCAALLAACSPTTTPLDGAIDEPCPADPPADGAPCSLPTSCVWERCPDGVVTATCVEGRYAVVETGCGDHDCDGITCTADAICVERQGGARFVDCAANPCGDGPITASCACTACGGFPCTIHGRGVICNTCASDICP